MRMRVQMRMMDEKTGQLTWVTLPGNIVPVTEGSMACFKDQHGPFLQIFFEPDEATNDQQGKRHWS